MADESSMKVFRYETIMNTGLYRAFIYVYPDDGQYKLSCELRIYYIDESRKEHLEKYDLYATKSAAVAAMRRYKRKQGAKWELVE